MPGFEAPVMLAYSNRNRSAAIRIPVSPDKGRRIGVRFPDPTANPYLAFTAMLMAGLDGIANKIDPGEAATKNLYDLPPEEEAKIPTVARSLEGALNSLDADHDFLKVGSFYECDGIIHKKACGRYIVAFKGGVMAKNDNRTGSLGFESKLWDAADLLRSNMDPAEYKHVVLGLIFLKYIEDAFEARKLVLTNMVCEPVGEYYVEGHEAQQLELTELLEDRDEFVSENVFWVPPEARWSHIRAHAKQPDIGKIIDNAMDAIERENLVLKGVLPKIYAMPGLNKHNLGKIIDLISGIGLGSAEHQAKDTLGRVYEYFLSRFASSEGKGGGEFYTPSSVVRVLVEMLEPYSGRVFDPCCGSGGMFVQSLKFIQAHNGKRDAVTVYG